MTFERKVAVQYLAHLLVGDGAAELGDGRRVVSVAFQQAPEFPVDDLVIGAARSDELKPSLLLSVGVRRSPNLVQSDQPTRELIGGYIRALINAPDDGPEHRLALVVAGPQPHAQQLGTLADLALAQMDAPGFFNLVETPIRFNSGTRSRLGHLEQLVGYALRDLEAAEPSTERIRLCTRQLRSKLTVLMPRLESPDETDWTTVANTLAAVARVPDLEGATFLRDRLVGLAGEYAPKAAKVNLTTLRRDAHELLDHEARRHVRGWQVLDHLHNQALAAVRDEIVAADGYRRLRIDRSNIAAELAVVSSQSTALVVSGESGVGKSALTLRCLSVAGTDAPDEMQVLCINLRYIHKLTMEFEAGLGDRLSTLLGELSAPHRVLIIDGADAVAEGMEDAFCYLVDAAIESDLKVTALTAVDNVQIVRDILNDRFGADVPEFTVPPLDDPEIREIVDTFPELENIYGNARSRELLSKVPARGVRETGWQEGGHRVILIGITTNPMREDRDGQEQHGPFGTTAQAQHGWRRGLSTGSPAGAGGGDHGCPSLGADRRALRMGNATRIAARTATVIAAEIGTPGWGPWNCAFPRPGKGVTFLRQRRTGTTPA